MDNIQLLDELIVGRVEPHIYAFTTNTVPDYLKVGDTFRPVSVRLNEWRKYFPDLVKEFDSKATITPEVFFRDFAVHQFLEADLKKHRLTPQEVPCGVYYSKEFFKDTREADVKAAVKDIQESYQNGEDKYQYYNSQTSLPEVHTYASTGWWQPRPNQAEAIRNFKAAVRGGRTNLLMYAVMRFGKSFTALCCAKEISARTVLVVSAKADVREEWKKTVQSADNFRKDYTFLCADELNRDENAVKNEMDRAKGAVIFLTLQDLAGDEIKEKHKEIFSGTIDLMIVDETHYGARAKSYGKVLRTSGYERDVKDKYLDEDFIELEEAQEQLKALRVKITLHLSGTPYRILMGSEFAKEDIVAFCQFSDIVKEQEAWDAANDALPEGKQQEEWKNPYFGFPQMVRFAFVPNASAKALLERLKSKGTTYAFSALFKPRSLTRQSDGSHKKFIHEKEVLDLFAAIDGSKEDGSVLSFLDYEKIKEGKMCRHIVCVLPYCASCDALEELFTANAGSFRNLGQYKVINISGVDRQNQYRSVSAVKKAIADCEKEDQKTITLTVNRMLTGSTVEQWDTMIFLKDTASPQEYDQAVFRLQNQYIRRYENESGETIHYNMKPQTLLVDFDPHRMFVMQEQKSLIYNANTDTAGNSHLRERMEEELRISPIITLNKDRVEQVKATDILSEISRYSGSRGVREEAQDIPVDTSLFSIEEILNEVRRQAQIGSRGGLQTEGYQGGENGTDMDEPEEGGGLGAAGERGGPEEEEGMEDGSENTGSEDETELDALENKFRTYYSRILFFAYLTEDTTASLDDILSCAETFDNRRIMANLQLDKNVLHLMRRHMNPFILNTLDYKIQNINQLSHDDSIPPVQRAMTAVNKFGKLSESEVTTPIHIAEAIIGMIPDDCFQRVGMTDHKILDIAGKMGEFAVAVCRRCARLGIPTEKIKDSVLTVATSPAAYEFTRKMYRILGLSTKSIAGRFCSYDLLDIKTEDGDVDIERITALLTQGKSFGEISLKEDAGEEGGNMVFDAVVGNPPYQEEDGGAGASSRPIYPDFVNIARGLEPDYASVIIPTRWYTGGKGGKEMDEFRDSMLDDIHIRELHDCLHPEDIFPDTNNRGGVCYFLWDREYDSSKSMTKIVTHESGTRTSTDERRLRTEGLDIFIRDHRALDILRKVMGEANGVMSEHVSSRKPYGIESNIVKTGDWRTSPEGMASPLKCVGKGRKYGYVEKELAVSHKELIDVWKVFTPRANNIGTELSDDNLNTLIGEPGTICTEAYIVIGGKLRLNEESAENLARYFQSRFVRFMHSLAKASHDATSKTYRFVPLQDFNEEWTDEKLYAKYKLTKEEIRHIEKSIKAM
ncbi:MAG: DEAD/DEAH box helicase family protein [Coprococcus sp.]|nr:DEAD/DEAH box helicase family protein [Coprococcus sp.]